MSYKNKNGTVNLLGNGIGFSAFHSLSTIPIQKKSLRISIGLIAEFNSDEPDTCRRRVR